MPAPTSPKERLVLGRERDKLEKVIGGVAQLNRLPAALLIVDIGTNTSPSGST